MNPVRLSHQRFRWCILVAIILLSPYCVLANDSLRYSVQHFTDENGLPQNSVKSIAPDKAGFLWLATENGIVKFDGHHFTVFNKQNLSLVSSRIYSILPVPANDLLYALTDRQEIICIEKEKVRVYPYDLKQFLKKYFYSADNIRMSDQGLSYAYYKEPVNEDLFLPASGNNYYFITKDTITFYRNYRSLYKTGHSSGEMQFFTFQNQLYHCSKQGRFTKIEANSVKKVHLIGDILNNISYSTTNHALSLFRNITAGNVFVYLNKHLYLLTRSGEGELKTQLILEGFDLRGNNIVSFYYDSLYKRLFLGSSTKGLFILSRQRFSALLAGNPKADEIYYAQAPYDSNSVITGLGEIMSPGKKTVTIPGIAEYSDRHSMLIDKPGNIWIKNYYFLSKFNGKTFSLLSRWKLPGEITQLYETKDGCLWIGTRSSGLYRMNIFMNGQYPQIFFNDIPDISYIMQEKPNLLWIGTMKGLYRLNTGDKKVDTIHLFKDMHIRSLYIPAPGEVWITTHDDGFFLYKKGQIIKFPLDKKEYLAASHCIVEDNYANFWITTNKGLFQTTRKNLMNYAEKKIKAVFYLYRKKERGFNTNEFNGGCQPCGLLLKSGQISLPSLNGMVWFDPAALVPEFPDKNIFINRLQIDNRNIAYGDMVFLPRKFNRLQFDISTPYFGDEYNIQLEYALLNNDADTIWSKLNYKEPIVLSLLASGAYQLIVRKISGFNNEYTYKKIRLIVPLAYYEKPWFKLLITLFAIAAVYAYFRYRIGYVRRKNEMLAGIINSHTQELQDTLHALTISENKLRRHTHTQDRLITAITHDIKSPLQYLTIAAGQIALDIQKEQDKATLTRTAKMLHEASYHVQLLTENLLQYIKLNSKDGNIICEKINLYDIIEDKATMFGHIAANKSTTIINDVPPVFYINSHARLLSIIIHNLLDNAIKVTNEGTVKISSTKTDQQIQVIIEDTGAGMSAAMIDWCNRPIAESGIIEQELADHMGLGLIIVKELMVLINGQFLVESDGRSGTTIRLIFKREMLYDG